MRQFDEQDLRRAATSLVTTALRVAPGERFVAVGDSDAQPMLTALEAAGRDAGAEVAALRLDQLRSQSTNHSGERPHKVLPDGVRRAMLSAQASAFVASAPHAEASMREQLLHCVGACRIRHAHMPGITTVAFAIGLATSFDRVLETGKSLDRALVGAREVTTESADGSRLVIRVPPNRWVPRLGQVAQGEAVTFPAGSLLASPESVSGVLAATTLGEFFGAREGLLPDPVFFDIEDGRVVGVRAPGRPQLAKDIEAMMGVAANSDRVGLVIIGAHPGIPEPTGEAAVDQHRLGLHLVIGDPQGRRTGATWSARTSFAACQRRATVCVDGQVIVENHRVLV